MESLYVASMEANLGLAWGPACGQYGGGGGECGALPEANVNVIPTVIPTVVPKLSFKTSQGMTLLRSPFENTHL